MGGHALVHTFELSIPVLVPLWLAQFDTTAAVIGVVVSVGYALFGIGALPGGIATDAVGSRRLIALCLLGMGGSFLLLSIAPSVWAIAGALLLWGVAASVYHPAGLTLISNGVTDRGRGFAYHGMAGNVGIALGPLVTLLLLLVFDWRTAVAILTVPALLAGVLAWRLDLEETAAIESVADGGIDRSRPSMSSFLSESKTLFASAFVFVFIMVMFSGLYYRGVLTFLPEIVGDFPDFAPVVVAGHTFEPAGYFYVGILMIGVAGQYVAGRLTDRMRPEVGYGIGFACLVLISVAFIPAAQLGLLAFLVVGALLGFFLFLVQPFYQATVAEYTPPSARGLSYGFTYLGVFGVGAGGGAIAGILITYAGSAELFLLLAAIAAGPVVFVTYLVFGDP